VPAAPPPSALQRWRRRMARLLWWRLDDLRWWLLDAGWALLRGLWWLVKLPFRLIWPWSDLAVEDRGAWVIIILATIGVLWWGVFIMPNLLFPATPMPSLADVRPTAPPLTTCTTIGRGVRLRATPGTDGTVLAGLPNDTVVTLLGQAQMVAGQRWERVQRTDDVTPSAGWISAALLQCAAGER
jgi:hypothetical protein